MNCTLNTTIFRLVPAGTRDVYAAGYEGNRFDTREEALAAIPGLRAVGPEYDHDWDVLADAAVAEARYWLVDYNTTARIREATAEERAESEAQAKRFGGAGVILVDGRSCYVE